MHNAQWFDKSISSNENDELQCVNSYKWHHKDIIYIYIIYISSNVTRLVIPFFVVHLNLALWIWGLKVNNTPLIRLFILEIYFTPQSMALMGSGISLIKMVIFGAILWYTFLVRLCIVDFSLIIIHQCLIIDARLGK